MTNESTAFRLYSVQRHDIVITVSCYMYNPWPLYLTMTLLPYLESCYVEPEYSIGSGLCVPRLNVTSLVPFSTQSFQPIVADNMHLFPS
jgi:hypothetical protein